MIDGKTEREWFDERLFMELHCLHDSVSAFLFRHCKDKEQRDHINKDFNYFLGAYVEPAVGELDIDLILTIISPEKSDFAQYIEEEFYKLVKMHTSVLQQEAREVLMNIIFSPHEFFKKGKEL